MEIYVADQTMAFLGAIALGAVLGLVYDVFRITRVAFPTARGIVFAEDILFFMICAASTFLYLMSTIQGKVRVFLLLGEILGSVLYYFTIGQLVMRVSKAIIEGIRRIIAFLIRNIAQPVWRFVYRIVYFILLPLRFLGRIAKKNVIKAKFHLKVRRVVLYNQFMGLQSRRSKRHTAEVCEGNAKKTGET